MHAVAAATKCFNGVLTRLVCKCTNCTPLCTQSIPPSESNHACNLELGEAGATSHHCPFAHCMGQRLHHRIGQQQVAPAPTNGRHIMHRYTCRGGSSPLSVGRHGLLRARLTCDAMVQPLCSIRALVSHRKGVAATLHARGSYTCPRSEGSHVAGLQPIPGCSQVATNMVTNHNRVITTPGVMGHHKRPYAQMLHLWPKKVIIGCSQPVHNEEMCGLGPRSTGLPLWKSTA
jgi:hypothetical protein